MAALAALALASSAHADPGELEAVRAAIDAQGLGWVAVETAVSRRPLELRPRGGALPPPEAGPWSDPPPPGSARFADQDFFDWRDAGGDYTTRVRDQGECGSCWAFAALAAMEAQYNIEAGDPDWDPDLSEQAVLSCSEGECSDGWWLEDTMDFLEANGAISEFCSRYEGSDAVPCEEVCSEEDEEPWELVSSTRLGSSISAIKDGLEHGPVGVWMETYEDLYYYGGGVYEYAWGAYLGGHYVLITGWDDDLDAWICKNSWGTDWGENPYGTGREDGFFRIAYEASGIQRYAPTIVEVPSCDCPDADGDGWQDDTCTNRVCGAALDCDDGDAAVHPAAQEICNDGVDNDCDGLADAETPDCRPDLPRGGPPTGAEQGGCGCGGGALPLSLWGLLGLGALVRRRRR
jgi:uncharacterized protein (TIGR03382 family)